MDGWRENADTYAGTGGLDTPSRAAGQAALAPVSRSGCCPAGLYFGTTGERTACFLSGTRRGCEPQLPAGATHLLQSPSTLTSGVQLRPGKVQGPGAESLSAQTAPGTQADPEPSGPGQSHHIPSWPLTLFPGSPPCDPSLDDTPRRSVPFTQARLSGQGQETGASHREVPSCPASSGVPSPHQEGLGQGWHILVPLGPAGDRRRRGR